MTTIRQLIQASPTRANELFSKLVDTSENAVKTREKLYSELKEELELLAGLEEQHLFPVLRKHKDLKDLVREALNDNKETRKLLSDLDKTAKDTDEFATRIADLRKLFQQHIRDEKKELLPAVLKALSDEEAEAVVGRIEAAKADIEEAKRAEAEERREKARREREKAEAEQSRIEAARRAEAEERRAIARREREDTERLRQAADAVVTTAWAAPRAAQKVGAAAQDLTATSVGTASELAQRTSQQVAEVFGVTRQRTEDLTRRASQNVQTVTRSGAVLAQSLQHVATEYADMVQGRVQRNMDGMNALLRCRSLPELVSAQGALLRDNLELTMSNGRRIVELSTRFAGDVARTVTARSDGR